MKTRSIIIALSVIGSLFATSPAWAVNCTHFDKYDWNEMTAKQRNLWGRLGWDAGRWDHNKSPASDTKDWGELSNTERQAALGLGISSNEWATDCGTKAKDDLKERSQEALENAAG